MPPKKNAPPKPSFALKLQALFPTLTEAEKEAVFAEALPALQFRLFAFEGPDPETTARIQDMAFHAPPGETDHERFQNLLSALERLPGRTAFPWAVWAGFELASAEAGLLQRKEASSAGERTKGRMTGALRLLVYQLCLDGLLPKAEQIQRFFGLSEEALTLPPPELSSSHEFVLGLLMRANMRIPHPIALTDRSFSVDDRAGTPTIHYRVEGDSRMRTCTDHNLRTSIIPAVKRALGQD